jgi:nitronate monooxygenase
VPLVPAGGINSFHRIAAMFELGASGVQIGTPFAVTEECDAHSNFKKVLAEAEPQDIVTFMSAAGLPARAVLTPCSSAILPRNSVCVHGPGRTLSSPTARARCGASRPAASRTGIPQPVSSASRPSWRRRGSIEKGLFFRGSESLPFGTEIRSVAELLQRLLTDARNTIDSFVADATRNAGLSAAAAV